MFINVVLSICLALCGVDFSQQEGWRGIVPLHSTRADVERILGPSPETGYGVTYDLGTESVTIEYSSCRCCEPKEHRWNVRNYTVVRISVSAEEKPRFSDLKVDRSKFKEIKDDHLPDWTNYRSNETGVTYQVLNDIVHATEYGPSAKDAQALSCTK